jgi:S-adenosylmethionine:tRNA ribosyltransferase-isomerase
MLKSDFYYDLPEHLIAQEPLPERSGSRLLSLAGSRGCLEDRRFTDLVDLLETGDLLVFNDTKVIPARLFGSKPTGGRVEILIERKLDERTALAQVRASKPIRTGTEIHLNGDHHCKVQGRQEDFYLLEFDGEGGVDAVLEVMGRIPLPPYIYRPSDDPRDSERYQTVYARQAGAVAAPTAGLHFDHGLLERLRTKGVDTAFLTLHVGSGTFQPVRVENLDEHKMHPEYCAVDGTLVEQVHLARQRGKQVIAVGTTAVRALETAAQGDRLRPYRGETRLFIKPGFRFRCVDALITNFHLPESTLLMLVCAFAGYEPVMAAYRHAVEHAYRFFSYGDAMFLSRRNS